MSEYNQIHQEISQNQREIDEINSLIVLCNHYKTKEERDEIINKKLKEIEIFIVENHRYKEHLINEINKIKETIKSSKRSCEGYQSKISFLKN